MKFTNEERQNILNQHGFTLKVIPITLPEESEPGYLHNSKSILFVEKDGYSIATTIDEILDGKPIMDMLIVGFYNPYSYINIQRYLTNNFGDDYLLLENMGATYPNHCDVVLRIKCERHNKVFMTKWNLLLRGEYCPDCMKEEDEG